MNDKIQAALDAVDAIDNDITMNAGQGSGPSLAIIRTALETQAAVIEYLATSPCDPDRCENCPENEACEEPAEAVRACTAQTIAAAFQAVEEER